MQLHFDYNNMMASAIGKKEGFASTVFEEGKEDWTRAYHTVMDQRGQGWQEWTELPYNQDTVIEEIATVARRVQGCEALVVLGIGGSALGPLAVANALLPLHHNESARRNAPKFYVEDNIDPERMAALLDVINLKKTVFNVVTKSGGTSETLSQFLILYHLLKKAVGEKKARQRIIVTTSNGHGTLFEIAQQEGFTCFTVPEGVGGRFSVLCPVGLVPLAILGFDVKALLAGATMMADACFNTDIRNNPALLTAYLQVLSMKKGRNVSVMMPYADSLKFMADFYCQIWAESLGKNVTLDGKACHVGQTPAKSLGVTDQHSQVQLYTEGPFDKVVTFLAVEEFRQTVTVPQMSEFPQTDFLQNATLNDLINYERKATEFALTKAKRANFTITLPRVNEETIGELLMYFEYQTAFAGALLNVDTYNQPGVEEGKIATFAMMGRKGYEEKMKEITSAPQKPEYTI